MTLAELKTMRRLRARPAFPIVMTDDATVHEFCTVNDLPVIWTPGLQADADFSPLYGLDVWLVRNNPPKKLKEALAAHRPKSMWVVRPYGYAWRVNNAVEREVMPWKS